MFCFVFLSWPWLDCVDHFKEIYCSPHSAGSQLVKRLQAVIDVTNYTRDKWHMESIVLLTLGGVWFPRFERHRRSGFPPLPKTPFNPPFPPYTLYPNPATQSRPPPLAGIKHKGLLHETPQIRSGASNYTENKEAQRQPRKKAAFCVVFDCSFNFCRVATLVCQGALLMLWWALCCVA